LSRKKKAKMEKVSGWDKAISDAEKKIKALRDSIAVFKARKESGEAWPEPSATQTATQN
jgi:hypothetical protein